MTSPAGVDAAEPHRGWPRSGVSWGLNALGVVVVGFWFVRNGIALHHPAWVWVVGAVALAAWVVRELAPTRRAVLVAGAAMVLAGALVVVPTDSLMVVPVIVGIVVLGAAPQAPVWLGSTAALVALVLVAVVATVTGTSVQFVLGVGAGMLLGVLVGFSRRQYRLAEHRARQAEREQARAELLADRARAARDVHDVLAHSLGGLVLQLDAVEALLEAGRTDEATRRAADARALAADGLAEARRAVRTLRDDAPVDTPAAVPPVDGPVADPDLGSLVDAHRSFGGEVVVQGDPALSALDDAHRAVVVAAVREALSNARRHAPGRPVSLSVIRDGDAVDVVVANPLTSDGHGLLGMRERFAELGSGAVVEAERSDDEFVVAMHVPVADAADAVVPEDRP